MASSAPTVRTSKRKRAEVKYYDSDSDDSDVDSYDDGATTHEHLSSSKKRKAQTTKEISGKPLPKKKIFPFVQLPAELKNQIYGLALSCPEPIFLVSRTRAHRHTVKREVMTAANASGTQRRRRWGYGWWRHQSTPSSPQPASTTLSPLVPNIMLLNKSIYAETRPILYRSNEIIVEDTSALHAFLAGIGSENVATLTYLTIKGWGHSRSHKAMNHPALTLLAPALNLRHLKIDCMMHYGGAEGTAKQLFRDGHHWFEARGEAAVGAVQMAEENFMVYRPSDNQNHQQKNGGVEDVKRMLRRLLER